MDYKESNPPKKQKKKGSADDGGSKEHKKNWRETTATVAEIKNYLSDNVYLRYNLVTRQTECRRPEPDFFSSRGRPPSPLEKSISQQWQQLDSHVFNSLWTDMSLIKRVSEGDMRRVIDSDFAPAYHPFLHYLDSLPPWDRNTNPILSLSVTVGVKGGADEQMLFYQCLEKWLVGMVAGWIDEEAVNQSILVFIGEQGSNKTTWFSHLLPPELRQYFRIKTNSSRMTKDDLIALTSYGLVCYEELDTMSASETNQLKSAVTMPSVDERRPYERFSEHRPHIASFCGTGNNVQFLTDLTGNRRWMPFETDFIMSPRESPFDHAGIFAQAYALYREGYRYWFDQQELALLNSHNETFLAPMSEMELVDKFFALPTAANAGDFVYVSDAIQIIGSGSSLKLDPTKVGIAFTKLGFTQHRRKSGRGYWAIQRSGDEIKQWKRMP